MMQKMNKRMNDMMQMHSHSAFDGGMGDMGGGQFVKQTFVSSMKMGPDGRPIQESYQTKATGATDKQGRKIAERQQAYHNTGTGMQKAAHERMLNGMGRKVVKERVGDQVNEYNHYKRMHEDHGDRFDQEWSSAAQEMGLGQRGALGYAQGGGRRVENHFAESRGLGMPDTGHYIPTQARAPHQPVRHQELQAQVPGARGAGFGPRNGLPEPTYEEPAQRPIALP